MRFLAFVVRVVFVTSVLALVASACAADVDPELTLLPAESTVPPTVPEVDEEQSDPEPISTTTSTEPPVVTTVPEPEGRTGNPRRAMTDVGDVLGTRSDGVVTFRSIPYAAAPEGSLRFAPPEPAVPFDDDFTADRPGAACPQNTNSEAVQFFPVPEADADCLRLDIFTPATGDGLPVMVWFHGGGFATGSAHSEAFDGSALAARGVVVVNVNYRVDALGFLVTEEIVREANGDGFGNRGLQDQAAALAWIQRNVGDFGGDAANVTIFGQGSGAEMVCGHMASPQSKGLFQKAILQSGGACDSILSIEEATDRGQQWLAETGCAEALSVAGCLQFLPTGDLLAASANSDITFGLVADGVILDRSALSLAATGELGDVPLLIGSTADEGSFFTEGTSELTDQELRDLVLVELGGNTDLLLSQYEGIETNLEKRAAFITDSQFACASDQFASAAGDEAVVYTYQLTHRSSDTPLSLGATHGSDVILLFGNADAVNDYPADQLNPDDALVSEFLQTAWTSFASEGVPGGGTADWPPYLDSSPAHLLIGLETSISAAIQDGRCEIFNAAQ